MWSRVYLRRQWFNLHLLLEATSTTRLTLRMCHGCVCTGSFVLVCYAFYLQPSCPYNRNPMSSFSGTGRFTNSIAWKRWKTFGTSDYFSGRNKKNSNLNEHNFDSEDNWSGVVNFHCTQMSLVMSIRFIFGDDWNIMFPWFSFIYQFNKKSSNTI